MATLSSLSSIMPKMMDMAQGYAQSDPILEQIRKKRMEREEQDRKNTETDSMNKFREAQAKAEELKANAGATTQAWLNRLNREIPLDYAAGDKQATAQAIRARIQFAQNSGDPGMLELAKTWTDGAKAMMGMMPAGGKPATMEGAEQQARIDKDITQSNLNRTLAKDTVGGPTEDILGYYRTEMYNEDQDKWFWQQMSTQEREQAAIALSQIHDQIQKEYMAKSGGKQLPFEQVSAIAKERYKKGDKGTGTIGNTRNFGSSK